jgi:hypothetical protein
VWTLWTVSGSLTSSVTEQDEIQKWEKWLKQPYRFAQNKKGNCHRNDEVRFTDEKPKATDSTLMLGKSFQCSMTQLSASSTNEKVLYTNIPSNWILFLKFIKENGLQARKEGMLYSEKQSKLN